VILGFAGLTLTVVLGFEEPNSVLLLLSSCLLLVPPAAAFAHLYLTRALTPQQRRIWFEQLTGRRALWAMGEYLTCDDVIAAAARFKEQSSRPGPQRD
jgi:hypothetical protein